MPYKVFYFWLVAAVVVCTIFGQWGMVCLHLQD